MNKNFAWFLLLVVGIFAFAIVIWTHVPRRAVAVDEVPATGVSLARTELGFTAPPDGRGGINAQAFI